MWKREEQWCDSVPVFPFSTHKTRTHALSALPLYNTPTPTRGVQMVLVAAYQRRPMPPIQRLCMSLPKGLVS